MSHLCRFLSAYFDASALVPFCGTYREAHAWSPQDMRYYDYFEAKRDAQASEEAAEVAAYIASQRGGPCAPADQAPFTRAAYRSLLEETTWESAGDGIWMLATDHEPALIDRVELSPGFDGLEIRILKGGREITRIRSGNQEARAVFANPLSSEELRVHSGTQAPAGIRLFGVPVAQLPEHNGYRRHLDHAR